LNGFERLLCRNGKKIILSGCGYSQGVPILAEKGKGASTDVINSMSLNAGNGLLLLNIVAQSKKNTSYNECNQSV